MYQLIATGDWILSAGLRAYPDFITGLAASFAGG
jgi:hypothetical protein